MLQFSANWNNESLTIVIIFTNKCVDNCMHEQHEQYIHVAFGQPVSCIIARASHH